MRIETLAGNVGIPVSIGSERKLNDNGTPYYLAVVIVDGSKVVTAIHADKAWRVREYLNVNDATGSHTK